MANKPNVIENLTPEQIAKFPEYVEYWTNIGLSTEPADMPNAIEAIKLCYRLAGQKEPTQFFHATGPLDAVRIVQELDPSKKASDAFNEMVFGNQDAAWLSSYHYMLNELNIEHCAQFQGFYDLAKYAGWCSVYETVVVIQDRPEIIAMDEQRRLHNPAGPAIRYRDGFEVYAWHGVTVPKEWIADPKFLTAQKAFAVENVEERRCAMEILGWEKILRQLPSREIDAHPNPQVGVLVEVDIPEIGTSRFLRVMCGTNRAFALSVPMNMKTAAEANAWTWGDDIKPDDIVGMQFRT